MSLKNSDVRCLCLGPSGSGKTLLLKKLQNLEKVDETSCTIPTIGCNLTRIVLPSTKPNAPPKTILIRELGGKMAPLWSKFYTNITKIIFVVDASNLCQISAAGMLLYSVLVEPRLQTTKILIVLSKMDLSYRQMRNEALLMLQMKRLLTEVNQKITLMETSAVTGEAVEHILSWLSSKPLPKEATLQPK